MHQQESAGPPHLCCQPAHKQIRLSLQILTASTFPQLLSYLDGFPIFSRDHISWLSCLPARHVLTQRSQTWCGRGGGNMNQNVHINYSWWTLAVLCHKTHQLYWLAVSVLLPWQPRRTQWRLLPYQLSFDPWKTMASEKCHHCHQQRDRHMIIMTLIMMQCVPYYHCYYDLPVKGDAFAH